MRAGLLVTGAISFLFLAGCGSGGNSGGDSAGGGGSRNIPESSGCLTAAAGLQARVFAGTASAVEAFAKASAGCHASLPELKARALKMQQDGAVIDGKGDQP